MNAHAKANQNARNARVYARELSRLWDAADDTTRAAGHDWYAAARAECEAIAELRGFPLANVAAAMAALSPRTRWNENAADTRTLASWAEDQRDAPDDEYGRPLEDLRRDLYACNIGQVYKAAAALCSDDPRACLNGPKERAFCANILGDPDSVTVDVWIIRAATGDVSRTAPTAREYVGVSTAIRNLARKVGETPANVQAAIWVQVRGRAD